MHRLGTETGISFIEVLSAIALFSVVAAAMTGSSISNMKLNRHSKTTAAATALVQNKIEQIRLTAPVSHVVPAGLAVGTHSDPGNPLTALDGSNGSFTRTWTVTTVPQYHNGSVVGARPAIVQVAVTVSWPAPSAGSVTAVTYACTTPLCG